MPRLCGWIFSYAAHISYQTPAITKERQRRLDELLSLRRRLAQRVSSPSRWSETVRRLAAAEVAAASTAMAGFRIGERQAVEISEGGRPIGLQDMEYEAVRSYRQAMDRVRSLAADDNFEWSPSRIDELHWLACQFQPETQPGHLRGLPSQVTGWDGRAVYEAPAAASLPALMVELAAMLKASPAEEQGVVQAAMAHLDVLAIQPYNDGNGRAARLLQSLILARQDGTPPELTSIEVYLAAHMQGYTEALQRAQGRTYEPSGDASGWLDFCLDAHRQETKRVLERLDVAEARSHFCDLLVARLRFQPRFAIPLESMLAGLAVRNESYRKDGGIAVATAKQDLARLVTAGWLESRGGGRNTHYVASARLTGLWDGVREPLLRQHDLLLKREEEGNLSRTRLRDLQTLGQSIEQRIAEAIRDVRPPELQPARGKLPQRTR
jgi:Fic family protein